MAVSLPLSERLTRGRSDAVRASQARVVHGQWEVQIFNKYHSEVVYHFGGPSRRVGQLENTLLGGLISNIQSLEFMLRVFLYKLPGARGTGIKDGRDIYAFPVQSVVNECSLTDYQSLSQLIVKFNDEMSKRGAQERVDPTLVDLRDALAHGRVSSRTPHTFEQRLIKYSRPSGGNVTVMFNEVMTEEWFKRNIERVRVALSMVYDATPPN